VRESSVLGQKLKLLVTKHGSTPADAFPKIRGWGGEGQSVNQACNPSMNLLTEMKHSVTGHYVWRISNSRHPDKHNSEGEGMSRRGEGEGQGRWASTLGTMNQRLSSV